MLQLPSVWITPLNRARLANAVYRYVFRAAIQIADARVVWSHFDQDCARGIWTRVDLPERTWDTSIELARKYGPTLGVRTLDSLHVACALELKAQRF
jgi:hypothetical protein